VVKLADFSMVKQISKEEKFPYIQTELFPATAEYISPELL
jgi:serine/threonine protein kinase